MARDLQFDVTARGKAEDLVAVAAQLKELGKQLREVDGKKAKATVSLAGGQEVQAQTGKIAADIKSLDGRSAKVKVTLDAASSAPVMTLTRDLDALNGKTARAQIDLTGAESAEAKATGFMATLKAIPNAIRTKIDVDLDKSVGERISGISAAVSKLGSFSSTAAGGVMQLRSAAQMIVNPSQIPIIQSVSDAIANKFHQATEIAAVGVERLHGVLGGLEKGLLGLGAAGNAVQVIGGLITSVTQLSGVALLAPAAILGIGTAFGVAKIAMMGFSEALTGSDKQQAEAYEKMGNGAKALVTVLKSLGPAANDFRTAVQDTAIAGFTTMVKSLASTYLPVLKSGLVGVAAELNGMARNAGTAVLSMSSISAVRTIIDNTKSALGNMQGVLANVVTGFLTLGSAGSSWLPKMGAAIDSAAAKFSRWTQQITQDGSFDRWVKTGIATAQQLGTVIGNIGAIVGTVFGALNANGQGLFSTLANLTGQLRTFLESAQGSAILDSLAKTLVIAGDAVSNIFGAALKALGPILVALGPQLQVFAAAVGEHLTALIVAATPVIERFAQALSAHPELLASLARAAAVAAIAFGPMVSIIGIAAGILQKMLLAAAVSAVLGQLGMAGGVVERALLALVSPLRAILSLLPSMAAGAGSLLASLSIAIGPIGYLIIAFAALYASSDQFRAAVSSLAGVIGGLFMQAVQQAGSILNTLMELFGMVGSSVESATSGLREFGSWLASAFGPAGKVAEDVLVSIFNALGNLPGAALAALAAFTLLGKIAPIFATASVAVAGFASRMTAYTSSSALATSATTGIGTAAGKLSTALSKMGSALPLIGVALIAVAAIMDSSKSKADEYAKTVLDGSQSMAQAVAAETKQLENRDFWTKTYLGTSELFLSAEQKAAIASGRTAEAQANVAKAHQEAYNALSPMEKLQADVAESQRKLNDAVAAGSAGSPEAQAAAGELAAAQAKLDAANKGAAQAANDHRTAEQKLAVTLRDSVSAALDYADAVERTAKAHADAKDALDKNGAKSKEYEAATRNLVRAILDQADAAKKQAEALGGTEAGVKTYNTEILRAADLSSKTGRDAFALLASSMTDVQLQALSATARMSGLKTEIMTLPDGRKVEVVVAADQGKLPDVKAEVTDFVSQKYVGTVIVRAETINARGDIQQAVTFANGQIGTMKFFADGSPAIVTIGATKYMVDSTTGTMKVLGDVSPGEANLSGFKLKVDATTGVMTIEGADGPVSAKTLAAKQRIDTSIGVMTIDGNPTLADGKTTASVKLANGSTGTITLDGNQVPVNGKIKATVDYGNGQHSVITLDPKDLVSGAIAAIPRTGTTVWTISYRTDGEQNLHLAQGGKTFSGGGVVGYSGGGIVGPVRAAGGMVLPGYEPGRDTVMSMLSKGEAVLVPELTRKLGANRIMAANSEASGGRPGTNVGSLAGLMDGSIRGAGSAGPAAVMGVRSTASTSGAAAYAQAAATGALAGEMARMRGDFQKLITAIDKQRPVNVYGQAANAIEIGRATSLAIKTR